MNREFFKSDRYFTFFDYLVSHGQLLLRSDKIKGFDVNIDIIFFGTTYIQLGTMLNGIKIRLAEKNEAISYQSVSKYLSYEENNLFEIESGNERYFIAAAFVKVFENNFEFNETSLNYENAGREIAGSK